jgi:predicted  nucleic acid-binding Zn-ribbon protein
MRELHNRFQGERNQLEAEIRRLREAVESRGRENEDLKSKLNNLTYKLQELTVKSENKSELEAKVRDYEGKIVQATRELERLNRVLGDKTNEANDLGNSARALNSKIIEY